MTIANSLRLIVVGLLIAVMIATCVLQPAQAQQRTTRYQRPAPTAVTRHQRPETAPTAINSRRYPTLAPAAGPIPLATVTPASERESSSTARRRS